MRTDGARNGTSEHAKTRPTAGVNSTGKLFHFSKIFIPVQNIVDMHRLFEGNGPLERTSDRSQRAGSRFRSRGGFYVSLPSVNAGQGGKDTGFSRAQTPLPAEFCPDHPFTEGEGPDTRLFRRSGAFHSGCRTPHFSGFWNPHRDR